MKLLWAHDHKFIKKGEEYYSHIEFPYEMWQRYLDHFDNISVASRILEGNDNLEDIDRMNLSSGTNVEFLSLPIQNSVRSILINNEKSKDILKKEMMRCDALIARLPSRIGNLAIGVAKKLKKPYAVELVGCPWDTYSNIPSLKSKIYAPYMYWTTKRNVKSSKYTLYVTKDFLQKRYPTDAHQIDCSNVNLVPANQNKKKSVINDKNEVINIGLIGYLSSYKGIDTALKAIRILKGNYPNIKLNILGGGDKEYWYDFSKQLGIDNSLSIQTLPSGPPVNEWIDQQYIYIQPSRTEGLPRGLIEAMNRGCPAVASSAGGIPELIQSDLIHSPGDYDHLAKLINKLINDKNLYINQNMKNFDIAQRYSKDNLIRKRAKFWGDFKKYIEKIN